MILVEKQKQKKHPKRKAVGIFDESSSGSDFSGFWWDQEDVVGNMYTMCKFPLYDRVEEWESVLVGLQEFKEHINNRNGSTPDLEKFCEKLREVSVRMLVRKLVKGNKKGVKMLK